MCSRLALSLCCFFLDFPLILRHQDGKSTIIFVTSLRKCEYHSLAVGLLTGSLGLLYPLLFLLASVVFLSSSNICWHASTHSQHMKTPGPAIIRSTKSAVLPQKLHCVPGGYCCVEFVDSELLMITHSQPIHFGQFYAK
jgi:hypothetical protein